MPYDHLVLSSGVGPNLNVVPGMADNAFPLKTVGDALQLRNHVLELLEKAELCEDAERRRWYLSYIVVGGGFSGVEVAGEINDLVRSSLRFFQNISAEEVRVTLIHSRDQLLPELTSDLRDFAARKMEKAGIKLMLRERVSLVTAEGVGVESGSMIHGATAVCTVGNKVLPFVDALEVPKERGRLATQSDMRLVGHDNVWAIGDCAHVMNAYDNQVSPPTGQFAERQGRQVAANLVRTINDEPTRPFHFRQIGQLCSIGGHQGVGRILGIPISGFLGWFIWRGIYLMKLPSWSRRVKVGFDWAWKLMFSRELAHLKTNLTERVSNAYYDAGDMVFREGDPATNLYVIKSGEVEVLQTSETTDTYETIAILGPGDFFGEMALVLDTLHRRSVRARTPLETVIMGKSVFSRISDALLPMQNILVNAIRRRSDIWQHLPTAHQILLRVPIIKFIEPLRTLLNANMSFQQAVTLFSQKKETIFFVVDDEQNLLGILTRTDLLRVLETAVTSESEGTVIHVKDIMATHPITVTTADGVDVAVSTMHDRGLKKLPLVNHEDHRRLVGYIRIETIMDYVIEKLRPEVASATRR